VALSSLGPGRVAQKMPLPEGMSPVTRPLELELELELVGLPPMPPAPELELELELVVPPPLPPVPLGEQVPMVLVIELHIMPVGQPLPPMPRQPGWHMSEALQTWPLIGPPQSESCVQATQVLVVVLQ
jgi:hypothetical protein